MQSRGQSEVTISCYVYVGKIQISISVVATGDGPIRVDQVFAGSHISILSGHVITCKLLVQMVNA